MKNILKKDTIGILKTRHKKSRNYGNAANQLLFPLGNDTANVMYNVEITHNCVNKNANVGNIHIPILFDYLGIGKNNNVLTLNRNNGLYNGNRHAINNNGGVEKDRQLISLSNSPKKNINSPY